MKKLMLIIASMFLMASMSYAGMNDSSEMMKKSGNKAKAMSCGAGKCGGDKMDKSGSCGAGKCGSDMKKKGMGQAMDKSPKKPSGSCGAGKCG